MECHPDPIDAAGHLAAFHVNRSVCVIQGQGQTASQTCHPRSSTSCITVTRTAESSAVASSSSAYVMSSFSGFSVTLKFSSAFPFHQQVWTRQRLQLSYKLHILAKKSSLGRNLYRNEDYLKKVSKILPNRALTAQPN